MALASVSLFSLAPRPAQAQALPPGWSAVPCDATGDTSGVTGFQGTQTGTLTRTGTYKDINDFILANPDYYNDGSYETAAAFYIRPAYLNADAGAAAPVNAIGVGSNSDPGSMYGMQALNYFNTPGLGGVFDAPGYNNEAVFGTLATDVSAGLTVYFKCVWQGSGPQPAYPAAMSLKVTTTVTTTGNVNYRNSGLTSGLTATANASDSLGDSSSVLVTSPSDASPPPLVTSYIVHASIDSGTGIASYGFSGTAQMMVDNEVQYTDAPYGRGTYIHQATVNANAMITAQAAPDSRMVTISSSLGQTSHKSTTNFDDDGVALPDPDLPTPDGTTNANSVKPTADDDELIVYAAAPAGSWAASSSYTWHLVQGQPYLSSSDGTFTMPNDPPNNYEALYSLASTTSGREHVYIHLTDAADGANATNNYYISWHDPVENWAKLGGSTEVAPKLFGTSDSAQAANGFANIKIAPDEVDWSVAEHAGGGVITTAAAVLAIAQPETSPVVIGLMTAAGYTLSVATPPDPTIYTPQGTEAQFEADVDTQNNITSGNIAGIFSPGSQRMDPTLAAQIAASGDFAGYFAGGHDHSFYFSVQAYRHRFAQPWIGDGYGAQGYYGRASGTITTSGSYEYVYDWT